MPAEVTGFHLPFDSSLQGDTLTLVVHAALVPTLGGEVRFYSNGKLKQTETWPSELWQVWPARWKVQILEAWHDKFELHAATALSRESDPRALQCHLELHVSGVDDSFVAPGHLKSRVDFFNRSEFAISSVEAIGGNSDPAGWDMTMDYRDIVGDVKILGEEPQRSAIHEFGHFLGLWHRCHGTEKGGYCKGGPLGERLDTMASGNDMRPWHAEPWLRRLHAHEYHQDVSWWAKVKGGAERSGAVQPGVEEKQANLARQDAMKQTAGLDAADVDALVAPPASTGNEAIRRRGLTTSVQTGLGLPLQ